MENSWLDSYYEAVAFYYAEPQFLDPMRYPAAKGWKFPEVKKHLQKVEVPLNHNIAQFFLLAPNALRKELFKRLFKEKVGPALDGDFEMYGCDVDTTFNLQNAMQPDFLFMSEAEVVSIEMKIKAKCSIDQVLKYALLGLAVEIEQNRQKEHYLVLFGKGDFARQFRGRFESISKLTDAMANYDLTSFLLNKPARFREHQERLKQIVEKMLVEFWTYQRLAEFLDSAKPATQRSIAGCRGLSKVNLRGY